jgi:uncharacterized membrane protein
MNSVHNVHQNIGSLMICQFGSQHLSINVRSATPRLPAGRPFIRLPHSGILQRIWVIHKDPKGGLHKY